jgi:putative endonuclease
MNQRREFGKAGEDLAVRYLRKKGYKILERNYTCPVGEIDIVARDKKTIVFVEVKTRRSMSYGSARLAITPHKQRKISMTALYYLKFNHQMGQGARFDVVTVYSTRDMQEIDLIKNAFDLAYP